MNKIKINIFDFIKKYYKTLLFVVIFALVTYIYNLNLQTINHIFKKGTILEYSISKNQKVEKDKLYEYLNKQNLKYSAVEEIAFEDDEIGYDIDYKKIEKELMILVSYTLKTDKTELLNSISDYVFENYPNSKLINIRTSDSIYSAKYAGFLKFLEVLFISVFFFVIILYIFMDCKKLNNEIKNKIISLFNTQKENIQKLCKKTKENGIGYFFKTILLDGDVEDGDITKEIINTIVFVLVAIIVIRFFIGELRWIPSGSMRPTILEHDRVFVQKLEYPKKEIERGDILVFYPPEVRLSKTFAANFSRLTGIFCKDIAFIKRVVGLPNEKFEIKYLSDLDEYRVFINDKPLDEPYINSKDNWTPCSEEAQFCGPFIIPENNYFMMGDNRGNSQDSRFWGFLDKSRVIGRANFMFWPIKRINPLRDKYVKLNKQKILNGYIENNYILDRY